MIKQIICFFMGHNYEYNYKQKWYDGNLNDTQIQVGLCARCKNVSREDIPTSWG